MEVNQSYKMGILNGDFKVVLRLVQPIVNFILKSVRQFSKKKNSCYQHKKRLDLRFSAFLG